MNDQREKRNKETNPKNGLLPMYILSSKTTIHMLMEGQ